MKGKVVNRQIQQPKYEKVIDYTNVAAPLTVEVIHDDITALRLNYEEADRIVMWEHQADWLTKVERRVAYRRTRIADAFCVPPNVLRAQDPLLFQRTEQGTEPQIHTLWGMPVEVRRP